MAIPNSRIIHAPGEEIIEMLKRRAAPEARKRITENRYDAVGLIHANLPNLYYYADIALKAGTVLAFDLNGSCPQHFVTLALLGDVADVQAVMEAIEEKM